MHSIADKMHEWKEDKGDETPRQKGQPHKRKSAGEDADPTAPDEVGDGLFKAGTRYKNWIFCCPADTDSDIKEGHTQSNVLDKITEAIRKLHKMQQEITGDAEWQHLEANQANDPAATAAAASSGARVTRPAEQKKVPKPIFKNDGLPMPRNMRQAIIFNMVAIRYHIL